MMMGETDLRHVNDPYRAGAKGNCSDSCSKSDMVSLIIIASIPSQIAETTLQERLRNAEGQYTRQLERTERNP